MVRARIPMRLDAGPQRRLVAPGDHGVDQPVRSLAGPILGGEALPLPVLLVIRQRQIDAQRLAADRAGAGRVALQRQLLLDAQQLAGAQPRAGVGGMVGRDVVGVGAVGLVPRQLDHARAERGEHGRRRLGRRRRHEPGCGHRLQIGGHRRDGLAIMVPAHPFDERRVRYAEAQQEAAAGLLGQAELRGMRRLRVARVDVGDAGGDGQPVGVGEQPGRGDQHVAPHRLRAPQRAIAPILHAPGEARRVHRGEMLGRAPDTETAKLHRHAPSRIRVPVSPLSSARWRGSARWSGPCPSRTPGNCGCGRYDGDRRPRRAHWPGPGCPASCSPPPWRA